MYSKMYRRAVVAIVLILLSVEYLNATNEEENRDIEVSNGCKCVLEYMCDLNNYIITNGQRAIQGRSGVLVTRIKCKGGNLSNEIVCCKLNDTTTQGSTLSSSTASSTTASTITSTTASNSNLSAVLRGPAGQVSFQLDIKCGVPKPSFDSRIHNRKEDLNPLDGEFPWLVTIFERTPSNEYKFICSGSLIHPNVVLTINHCVYKKKTSDIKVAVNGGTKRSISDFTSEEQRKVSEVINHPGYNDTLLYNDAALLVVDQQFKIESWSSINTLCLPPDDFYLEGKKCLVAGWGDDNDGQHVRNLRKVEVPFVNHTHCQSILRKTALRGSFNLHSSFLCAGGKEGRDACVGDGGSPLMCQTREGSGQYFQAGIVSWGIGCGVENVPGVYTDVGEISEWIKDVLDLRQLNI